MNVLHYGLILNQPYETVRGLRDIGVSADYGLWDDCGNKWLIRDWDINLRMESLSYRQKKEEHARFLSRVIDTYDVIHFHSHPTFWYTNFLFSNYSDARELVLHDKKLFISFWGCEARQWLNDIKYHWSPCRNCGLYKRTYCGTCSKKVLAAARKYCNAVFSVADICVDNPDIHWSNIAIDTRELDPEKLPVHEKETDDIIIYHSFGNSTKRLDVKGIRYINKTVDKLVAEGYKIKYVFADTIPNEQLKYIQIQADIVIDQLCAGWYGTAAVECMALGKPVLSYIREENLAICPNENVPIINVNPITLEETLRILIDDPSLIHHCGKKSREYAVKYHDNRVVAANFLKYYKGEL